MVFDGNILPVCLPDDLALDLNALKPGKSVDVIKVT